MSLDQVAEQTGVSKSMLAQIERGRQIRLWEFWARSPADCGSNFSN